METKEQLKADLVVTEGKETKELTYGERMAQLIMAEPDGLCQGDIVDPEGVRCVNGAVGDVVDPEGVRFVNGAVGDAFDDGFFYWRQGKRLLEFDQRYYNFYQTYANRDSDDFQGTNKARQLYMAEKVRVLR